MRSGTGGGGGGGIGASTSVVSPPVSTGSGGSGGPGGPGGVAISPPFAGTPATESIFLPARARSRSPSRAVSNSSTLVNAPVRVSTPFSVSWIWLFESSYVPTTTRWMPAFASLRISGCRHAGFSWQSNAVTRNIGPRSCLTSAIGTIRASVCSPSRSRRSLDSFAASFNSDRSVWVPRTGRRSNTATADCLASSPSANARPHSTKPSANSGTFEVQKRGRRDAEKKALTKLGFRKASPEALVPEPPARMRDLETYFVSFGPHGTSRRPRTPVRVLTSASLRRAWSLYRRTSRLSYT